MHSLLVIYEDLKIAVLWELFSFSCGSYINQSKQSIIPTVQRNWLCAEMVDQNYQISADVARPITQPAESSLGKGRDYIITLPAPPTSQPQS